MLLLGQLNHLNGHCFHLEADWLASAERWARELSHSGSSLRRPFVGHRLIYKWDSILMTSTEYWFNTVHICWWLSRTLQCDCSAVGLTMKSRDHFSLFIQSICSLSLSRSNQKGSPWLVDHVNYIQLCTDQAISPDVGQSLCGLWSHICRCRCEWRLDTYTMCPWKTICALQH